MSALVARPAYAAIGSDGTREVVWGVGPTAEAAENNARAEAREAECDPELTRTVRVTAEQVARISRGVVGVADLGLVTTAQRLGLR